MCVLFASVLLFVSVLLFLSTQKKTPELQRPMVLLCFLVHYVTTNLVVGLRSAVVPWGAIAQLRSQFGAAATQPLHRTTLPAMAVGLPCTEASVVGLGL